MHTRTHPFLFVCACQLKLGYLLKISSWDAHTHTSPTILVIFTLKILYLTILAKTTIFCKVSKTHSPSCDKIFEYIGPNSENISLTHRLLRLTNRRLLSLLYSTAYIAHTDETLAPAIMINIVEFSINWACSETLPKVKGRITVISKMYSAVEAVRHIIVR